MTKTKLVRPEVFGAKLSPPRSGIHILRLCRDGRIKGAVMPGNEWLIPEDAKIEGRGLRLEYGRKSSGLSASQFARKHGRHRSRVYQLLKQGRIEGQSKTEHGWNIPEDAPWPADDGF